MLNFRTHSRYSYKLAISKIDEIASMAKDQGENSFCISDIGSLKSFVKAFTIAKKMNMKFIPGCEFLIKPEDDIWDVEINNRIKFCKKEMTLKRTTAEMYEDYKKEIEELENRKSKSFHSIVLIAKNQTGFENLMNIYNEEKIYEPKGTLYLTTKESIFKNSEGLIAITTGYDSDAVYYFEKNDKEKTISIMNQYKNIFGDDFYCSLESIYTKRNEKEYKEIMGNFASFIRESIPSIPFVCINDSRYPKIEDRANYRLYRQIIGGDRVFFDRDGNHITDESELRDRMKDIYSEDFINEGFENIKVIENKIGEIHEPTAEPLKDCSEQLTKLCEEGWNKLRKDTDRAEESRKRYEYELSVINGRNFSEYFIKVLTIVKTAKKLGILIGPARGSGAGSEVCYLIGITHVDPLKYGLFFERFLNPERHGFPDIDLDMATVPLDRDNEENRILKDEMKPIMDSRTNLRNSENRLEKHLTTIESQQKMKKVRELISQDRKNGIQRDKDFDYDEEINKDFTLVKDEITNQYESDIEEIKNQLKSLENHYYDDKLVVTPLGKFKVDDIITIKNPNYKKSTSSYEPETIDITALELVDRIWSGQEIEV